MTLFGQENNKTSQNDDVIESFIRLSSQQLYDTANYYFNRYSFDTALICYNLFINTIPKNNDIEQQRKLAAVYNGLNVIYFSISDYRIAYDYCIKRLQICEKYNFIHGLAVTYTNIGIIYNYLKQYETAKDYYLKSLEIVKDTSGLILLLNNLGDNEMYIGNMDSAYYYIDRAIYISKQYKNVRLNLLYTSLGEYYQKIKLYDSAFHYFHLSLFHSTDNNTRVKTMNLSNMGKFFFEINKIDSALYYIDLSNKIALENNFLNILSENLLTLSEIEKSRGRYKNALEFYETYNNLKDSISNSEVYSSVNQMHRSYEVSKTNQQIEELLIDQQIKENTIHYQKIIQWIIIVVLYLAIGVIAVIIFQNRNLKKTQKILFATNVELIEVNEKLLKKDKNNNKPHKTHKTHQELMSKITMVMEDPKVYCDPDFSVNILAALTHSNQSYITEAIKNNLNKNFRTFLNSYRIREAQRIFMEFEAEKYSIDSVFEKVGFKSRSVFYNAFKAVTGVSPIYYLKSINNDL